MPIFIDPTGQPTFGIGICARCSQKFPLADLMPDPNSPGLMVCEADLDVLDPYRLPARQTEDITLPFVRPDTPLDTVAPNTAVLFLIGTSTLTYLEVEPGVGLTVIGV